MPILCVTGIQIITVFDTKMISKTVDYKKHLTEKYDIICYKNKFFVSEEK